MFVRMQKSMTCRANTSRSNRAPRSTEVALKTGFCCRNGSLPAAAESCKKGTLKLDLQSLTVGVAVVSMGAWLLGARGALLQDAPTSLDAARKLAVVNGLGEHSRAQVLAVPLAV